MIEQENERMTKRQTTNITIAENVFSRSLKMGRQSKSINHNFNKFTQLIILRYNNFYNDFISFLNWRLFDYISLRIINGIVLISISSILILNFVRIIVFYMVFVYFHGFLMQSTIWNLEKKKIPRRIFHKKCSEFELNFV